MAKHEGIFTRLIAKYGTTIISKAWLSYFSSDGSVIPQSALPDDNSLVTRGMLNIVAESIPSTGGQVTQLITAGTTPVTETIPYTGILNPTVLFRDASGNVYTGYINYQDTGTDIIVTSPDNGSGNSIDTYNVIIKP